MNEEQEMDKSSEAEALDQSFSYKSGTPSRDDVLLIAHELGTKWKMLGRVLDVSEPVLEQIEKDNDELSERCYKVLIRWQERFASEATYQRLAQALQHPPVDRAALAVKYCEKKTG
ncbi:THO complex subunit 1-like isoform X2 [Montipora capricornis]|uniref:THO complex subunit 1-like isoform X2 n=1 Tax=Montipora capricornis TaxID=246305 RepID=UPI0035F12E11